VLAGAAAAALVGASIVLSITPVSAAGLEAFASCDELQAHLQTAAGAFGYATEERDVATGAPTPSTAAAAGEGGAVDQAGTGDDDSGGTNTQVAGVDELDIVEVLADGRILAARDDRIVLIDASGEQILAALDVPVAPRITFDEERSTLWAVSSDWQTTTLTRAVLDGNGFTGTDTWTLEGRLVDLRRSGDRVHLVAVDDEVMPVEPGGGVATRIVDDVETDPGAAPDQIAPDASDPGAALPFGGTSPVPCDQVLHSPLPGGPATTLVATFAASGDLAPVAATEIVGAGDNILVTDTALYVSTPSYDADKLVTGIHRFDLDGLTLTGSGSVEGRLLNQFSLDEHEGHLRAAVTIGDGGFIGEPMPMPVEGDVGVAVGGSTGAGEADAPAQDPAAPTDTSVTSEPLPPETTVVEEPTSVPETTTVPETTVVEEPTSVPETTTVPETTVVEEPPVPTPETTVPGPAPATEPLNEIVTFDLDGALDVVGRSARFGHEGETLHGIRFAGDIAYAVTFLQTDPLYVIDLSQPELPRVLGQVEIPGFSAYLHPISDTQVIGFGPDGEGHVVARLFDITDPAAPQLLDTVIVAADSPVVYDHHALRADGGRLLVAANDWVAERPASCGPIAADQAELDSLYRQIEELYGQLEGKPIEQVPPEIDALQQRIDELSRCAYPSMFPQARIVTLTPGGGSLGVATIATTAGEAQRVLAVPGGYLIVGPEITRVGPSGATLGVLS
jgi:uncharacterized secreted protein with C-terminal beta-propeller domain